MESGLDGSKHIQSTQKGEMGLSVFRPHLSLLMSTPHLEKIVDYPASGFNPDCQPHLTLPIA